MKMFTEWKEVVEMQQVLQKQKGIDTVFSVFDFKLENYNFNSKSFYDADVNFLPLINQSKELLDSYSDGEYRVYNFIFLFENESFKIKFYSVLYFMLKDGNIRSTVLVDISPITETLYKLKCLCDEKIIITRLDI
jgi:hypothetical protein